MDEPMQPSRTTTFMQTPGPHVREVCAFCCLTSTGLAACHATDFMLRTFVLANDTGNTRQDTNKPFGASCSPITVPAHIRHGFHSSLFFSSDLSILGKREGGSCQVLRSPSCHISYIMGIYKRNNIIPIYLRSSTWNPAAPSISLYICMCIYTPFFFPSSSSA